MKEFGTRILSGTLETILGVVFAVIFIPLVAALWVVCLPRNILEALESKDDDGDGK